MARRKEAHGGGHGWFVTFADLMGLLVSFFVMLVAFSNQDEKKVQAVAGSLRDAFGVQQSVRYSGIMESDGLPTRPKIKNAAHIRPEDSSVTPTPDEQGSSFKIDQAFALAAASLRQALHDMPELTEASRHIMIEETQEGLNIDIVDQDGRSMFPEGSKEPYEHTRKLFKKSLGHLRRPRIAFPSLGTRPVRGLAAAGLWAVEPFGRPCQYRAPNPGGRGLPLRQHLQGSRQGRY